MKTYTLKEVSSILEIPKSTLRYWEKEGLIRSQRNVQNEYREYTTEDLLIIADIAFYRNLHLPIKALKSLHDSTIEDKFELLKESYTNLSTQIKELQRTQDKISKRMASLTQLDDIKNSIFTKQPPFSYITHLHMEKQDTVKAYLEDQTLLAIVFNEEQLQLDRYGLTQHHIKEDSTILWQKKKDITYVPCLVRVIDRTIDIDSIQEELHALHEEHKKIGSIIGNYLITDKDIDYFQAWIEVLPNE